MISLSLKEISSILCIGAHADDIEIGCGGTLLSLLRANNQLSVGWVVLSSGGEREAEARESASAFLAGATNSTVEVKQFRNGFFPYDSTVKDFFEDLKQRYAPDLVLTHRREDRHQDHRTVSDLTWNTFRDNLVLEYEIPKWDGDLGQPNIYAPLQEWAYMAKIEKLAGAFASQQSRPWYDPETFRGLMRLRGMECNAASRYAEGFFGRKLALSV